MKMISKIKQEAYRFLNPTKALPLAIDIYKDNAVIHVFGNVSSGYFKNIEKSLHNLHGIKDVFYKDRRKAAGKPANAVHKEIIIEENGHKFLINLSDYLDTGLFLDHRETRKWIGSLSNGKTVLNTFAYTGSFTVYAAAGGAEKTYSVDLSKTYCEWIRKNFELNRLQPEKNWVYKMDTLEFIKYALRKGLSFDIIIIDPPTFSKNKSETFSVQKDHPKLINEALNILNPDGLILFSNNYSDFKFNKPAINSCEIKEDKSMIPPDFSGCIPHRTFIIKNTK